MRLKPIQWCLISLLLFVAAICAWRLVDRMVEVRPARTAAVSSPAVASPWQNSAALLKTSLTNAVPRNKTYRLSNTRQTVDQLIHNRHAILLRNALIDTEVPVPLDIPEHLRAKGAPGSYLVQADRPLDKAFYAELNQSGATYLSYVPNDTALVKATPEQATNLSRLPDVIVVLPYDPYYKLDNTLLPTAVEQQPVTNELCVTTFPGQRDAALAALTQLGAKYMGENDGPFGPTLMVSVPPQSLVAVAQLPLAQEIEAYHPRRLMNDLTRVLMGESSNTLVGTPTYMSLSGSNVTVNINDTGVDATHPDLGPVTRLYGVTNDYDGHGTHIAGIIAGNGSKSLTVPNLNYQPWTNVPGSIVPGADFRGKATNASLYIESLDLIAGPYAADSFLQANASSNLGPTNLISNNSWGYGQSTVYDMAAASYDAATRDAQPNLAGEQPLLFVFAAGNGGAGDDTGVDGVPGTIFSPATAKNVITVGCSDSPRFITNNVDGSPIWLGSTDNSNLVSASSSCGNVGIGIEGTYGRFKPDVVAPGIFTISCRASNFVDPAYGAFETTYYYPAQTVDLKKTNSPYVIPLPKDTQQLYVVISSNIASPQPFPTNMILLGNQSTNPPTTILSTNNYYDLTNFTSNTVWFFGVAAPSNSPGPVSFDITFYLWETNQDTNYFMTLSNLNNPLRPYYVYSTPMYFSGTSMSAAAVSGTLALMQEFLQGHTSNTNPSPALMKAMLINGSRTLGDQYDFSVQKLTANEQGWGMPNITNCIPPSMTNSNPSMLLVDQSSSNALATGQYQTYTISCSDSNAAYFPLRFTLVWTDPPGNPAAGMALVNNLDLTVIDSTGSNVYIGNDFAGGDIFTEASNPTNLPGGESDNTVENIYSSNGIPTFTSAGDAINNVQNIYISTANGPISFPLTVTVSGTRVNVNAVTTQTNNILQDFALVISSDDSLLTSPLTIVTNGINSATPVLVTVASNGVPLLHERVGANEPNIYNYALGSTNGTNSQWHFFVFTNDQFSATNQATNVAITTFLPPNLSIPRASGSADIDLYVSTDPTLTNLNPAAIQAALKSLGRTGDETIILSNSAPNTVYYAGVKSEDQQAADFGFYAIAQQAPFSTLSGDGNSITANSTSLPVFIPTALTPTPALAFAFMIDPNPLLQRIRNVRPTVGIEHASPADLYGTIQHTEVTTILNDHTGSPGGYTNTYDDLQENPGSGSVRSDGVAPNNLTAFDNQSPDGLWLLSQSSVSASLTGYITTYSVAVDLHQPATSGFFVTIPANSWFDDYVYVPNDTTNMIVAALYESYGTNAAGTGPIGIYLTNVAGPLLTTDYGSNGIGPPGGTLTLSTNNPVPGWPGAPPLSGGFWYYGIYNSSAQPVSLYVQIFLEESLTPDLVQTYSNNIITPLTTDGHTQSQICISNGQQVVSLQVGVVINDTNLDDLVLHLTSPEGTSVNLFENRGGLLASNLGLMQITNLVTTNASGSNYTTNTITNYVYTVFTENTNLATTPIKFGPPPYATNIVIPLQVLWTNSWETCTNGIYTNNNSNNIVLEGWLVTNNISFIQTTNGPTFYTNNEVGIVVDPYGDLLDSNSIIGSNILGSNYLALTSGRIIQTFGGTNANSTLFFTNSAGLISPIFITNGQPYQLQFYVKPLGIVDWWPGDDNAHDIVGTNNGMISVVTNLITNADTTVTTNVIPLVLFDTGEVGRSFTFQPVTDTMTNSPTNLWVSFGTNTGNIGSNDFTVDFWIKTTDSNNMAEGILGMSNSVNPNSNYFGILLTNGTILYEQSSNSYTGAFTLQGATNVCDGQLFHYVAITRHTNLVSIYIDGILDTNAMDEMSSITNTNGLVAGAFEGTNTFGAFTGDLDEIDWYSRALSAAEIQAIYNAGNIGKYNTNSILPNFQLTIDGVSTNIITLTNPSGDWQLVTNSFIATNSSVTVEFAGNTMGVLLDDIALIQLPATNYNNYYLPEEPLSPLVGENPLGCWTLDVWDTRNDSPLPTNGTLLSWSLQVTTSSTNAVLYVLTNEEPFEVGTNLETNIANGMVYFAVDVPSYVHDATNILRSQTGGALTLYFDQYQLPTGGLPGDYILTSGLMPTNSSTNVLGTAGGLPPLIPGQRYYLGVLTPTNSTFSIEVDFDVQTNLIIPLTNAVAYTNIIGTNTAGTNGPQYYSFTITNTNAAMVTFQILNDTNGEVDLYARQGLPVPTPLSFDYASRNACSNDQFIVITTNSVPVPLSVPSTNDLLPWQPVTWYLAAYNFAELTNIGYSIVATVVTNGAMDIIPLTNGIAYSNVAYPGYPTNLLYSFTVTNNPPGLQFVVTNLTNFGTVQLLSSLDVYPTPQENYAGSYIAGTNAQMIQVVVNPNLTNLNGTWYLSVPNIAGSNIAYTITATTNVIIPPPNVPLTWNGNIDDNWDILVTSNWLVTANLTQGYPYQDGSGVTFDNHATRQGTVNIITTVSPTNIVVDNATYMFIGSGINDSPFDADLVISNGGNLTLDNAPNNFLTVALLAGGSLTLGNNDTLGSIASTGGPLGAGGFVDNGTLIFNRSDIVIISNNIGGLGALSQIGSGIVFLAGSNSYAGATMVTTGTLVVGSTNALGQVPGGIVTVGTPQITGTLDLGGIPVAYSSNTPLFPNKAFSIAGAGVGGKGTIVNTGAFSEQGGLQSITLSSNATIGGTRRWDIRSPGPGVATLVLNGYTLTKTGRNQIRMGNVSVSAGSLIVNQGTLSFDYPATFDPSDTITVNAGARVGQTLFASNTFLCPIILNGGGATNLSGAGVVTYLDSTIQLTTNSWIGNGAGTEIFDGVISGPYSLTNLGLGTNYLAASNTYSGSTLIEQGTFGLIGTGTITNTTNITLATNAIFDASERVDQTLTLFSNQTFYANGTVFGSAVVAQPGSAVYGIGTITNSLLLNSNTIFSPGPDGTNIGTITVSNLVDLGGTNYMKINKDVSPSNDMVLGSNIIYGGTLIVTNTDTNTATTFVIGDSFLLYNVTNSSNAFAATNYPPLPGGLMWSNTFGSNGPGIITVVSNPNYVPPIPLAAITWSGEINSNWDILTPNTVGTSNWFLTSDLSTPYAYEDGDPVTFDDNLIANNVINITTAVSPASVTVTNFFFPYTFVGKGGINGAPLDVNGTLTIANKANNFSSVIFEGGTLQLGNGGSNGSLAVSTGILGTGAFTNNGTLIFDRANSILVTNIVTGPGNLSQNGAGTLTLTASNAYTGATTVSNGTLALGAGGAIGTSAVTVFAGATLANATSTNVTIGGSLTWKSTALASFAATGPANVGSIGVAGNVTLNNTAMTVNVSGAALTPGDYPLVTCTGTLAGAPGPVTISGVALPGGYIATLAATAGSGGHVDLIISGPPAFSGLSATPSIVYGTTNITLAGTLSEAGATNVYPANGDTVSVTINGHTVNGTISDSTGDFSVNYNDPSLKSDNVPGSPYVITYSYAGNPGLFLAGATNTNTSLTVTPLPAVLTGTRVFDGTATATASILSVSNAINGDAVSLASGAATLASSNIGVQPITSFGTLTLGGANAANYTLAGASGAVTITATNAPIMITSVSVDNTGTNLIIIWQSVPGKVYQLVATTNLAAPLNTWTNVGGPITATNTTTSETVAMSQPYDFFMVESGNNFVVPASFSITSAHLDATGTNIVLTWQSTSNAIYQVVANTNIAAPMGLWSNIGTPVTATNSTTTVTNPITQPYDFYRVESP